MSLAVLSMQLKRHRGNNVNKIIGLSVVLLLSACSEQYRASKNAQESIDIALSQYDISVSNIEISVNNDHAKIIVENAEGIDLVRQFYFPRPNIYQGRYSIEYSCEKARCSLLYDEKAAEIFNDRLLISLFEKHVQPEVKALEQKVKMLKN